MASRNEGRDSEAPRRTRRRYALLTGFALLLAAVALWTDRERTGSGEEFHEISGAYGALSFWGDSRRYPEANIPSGAYMRAYEYSKAKLRGTTSSRSGPSPTSTRSSRPPAGALGLSAGWEAMGPKNSGGRTLTIAFDPLNPNTIYAGSASGGLWRSTTGGVGASAWERIDTGLPVLGVSTIAFEPGNSNVMYIGTGEVYNHQTAGDLAADRRTRGSYGVGILKTVDGGATWSKSLDWSYNQRHGVWAVRVDPSNSNVVWAATTDGVYKSTDAGLNWTQKLAVIMATDLIVHPVNTDTVLVGCGDLSSAGRGLYRTTDGGDAWTQVTGGGVPTDFAGKIQFGVTPADNDVVYASIGNGFEVFGPDNFTWLLRSTDFGATFSLQSTTDYSRWQGWYAHDVAVHPLDPNTLICVGIDAWKSTNAGVTLTQKSDWSVFFSGTPPAGGPEGPGNYSHADHHEVIYHPTDPNIVYYGNDGGVFRSVDGGETFAGANGGYQVTQFYNGTVSDPTDPNLAMGGLQDNASAIYRGTGDWQRWVLGGDGGWCAIDPTDPDVVYATAQFLFVGLSLNGGASFSLVSPPDLGGPVAFIAPLLMSPTNPLVLYAGSDFLFKTFNGGGTWFLGQGGAPIDGNPILLLAVAQQNDAVLYLATAPTVGPGSVQRTQNGGASFIDVTGTLPDRYPGDMTVDPTDEATVYITMSGFGSSHAFKSSDYGTTWTDIDRGILPDVPTTAIVVDPDFPDHVYVGNDIGVYFTRNEGFTWLQLKQGLSEAVLIADLNISPAERKLRAFTHGQGAFQRDLINGDSVDFEPTRLPGTPKPRLPLPR